MNKSLILRMIIVLVAITFLSALLLSITWSLSISKIKLNEQKVLETALYALNPTAAKYDRKTIQGTIFYQMYDQQAQFISYAFIADGSGFQANIKTLVSVDPTLTKILGIRILEQSETPGLGTKIMDASFLNEFVGLILNYTKKVPLSYSKSVSDKKHGVIKAITGATISSRAVVNLINQKITKIKPFLKKEAI